MTYTREEWYPILPENFEILCAILESVSADCKIVIVDDKDCDGQLSAHIAYNILKNKFSNIHIHINDRHGLTSRSDIIQKSDLLIIVDSSSELVSTYGDLNKVIVIDHHNYQLDGEVPENVLLLNSKDVKGLECISAGMYTYILLSEYAKRYNIPFDNSLFSLGALTLYSDIVPVDNYVKLCLTKLINEIKDNNINPLINSLNFYFGPLNRGTFSFSIVPSINYTRKIMDETTIRMMYRNLITTSLVYIQKNTNDVKSLLAYVKSILRINTKYRNFVFADITDAVQYLDKNIKNFKGLICNQLQTEYGKPAVISYKSPEETFCELSFRSNKVDSFGFVKKMELDGGGHLQACGCMVQQDKLEEILLEYDNYLEGATKMVDYIEDICPEQLESIDFLSISYENEFRFSNLPTKKYRLTVAIGDIENIDFTLKKMTINNVSLTWYMMAKEYPKYKPTETVSFIITPTMESHILSTYILVANVER